MEKEDYKKFYNKYWVNGKSDYKYRYGVFLSWIDSGSKILDLGCGDGYLAEVMVNKKNCDVTCLDISEVALKKAGERGLKTICASVEDKLPFEDSFFDYVIATEVLEHVVSTEDVLLEMARVSKKHILVSIPNIAFWRHRLSLLMGRFPKQWVLHPKEHLRFWSVFDFKKTIEGLGLNIDRITAGSGRRFLRDLWPNLFAEQVCFKLSKRI